MTILVAPDLNPDSDDGVKTIRAKANEEAGQLYNRDHPDTLSNEDDVRELARTTCRKLWQRLSGFDDHADWYSDVERYYIPAFVRSYMWYVEQAARKQREEREAAARWKAEQREREQALQPKAEKKEQVTVQIRNHRLLPDGVLYEVDFFDRDRMTQAISFGVSVKDDGLVELEEL
jgi:hypothetical protein